MGAFDPNLNTVELEPVAELAELEEAPPQAAEQAEAAVDEVLAPTALPLPLPLRLRTVSGSYAGTRSSWRLDLRVDVDGARPMTRVSGDYFSVSGATTSYFGSFVVDAPTVTTTATAITLRGRARATWSTSFDRLEVKIPRRVILLPPAPATATWRNAAGSAGASYLCDFVSRHFRTVELEEDCEQGVTPFMSYNTGSLPSGGPARTLTTLAAYAEAGIDMRSAGTRNVIATAEAGVDARWSNAELHASMVRHFSLWRDEPQWKVWLLHAMRHEYGPTLLGIMFDQQGRQRQGCAGFYQSISGTAPTRQRDQLYVCVHELGHCFNLYHSFHKQYMTPPMPNREWSLSWMNYPQNFRPAPPAPGGAAAFWSAFPFQFDDLELIHLRHGFRNNVIMGGNPFGTGAALTTGDFAEPVEDRSGLALELEAKPSFLFGEPVVVEIKLRSTDNRGKRVHKQLNPNFGFVEIAIQRPGGEVLVYDPPLEHCTAPETAMLSPTVPSAYSSAYIGYCKGRGQVFDAPGRYRLRALYHALDGSRVVSPTIELRVRAPLSHDDEAVADLMLGDDQGMLMYLLGSDAEELGAGTRAFGELLERHPQHPLATYVRMANGFNAMRAFKLATPSGVRVRKANPDGAAELLAASVQGAEACGVDNITINLATRRLARAQAAAGRRKEADKTLKDMVERFRRKNLKPHVMATIEAQVKATTASFAG
jgi:hypothetical protein